MDEFWLTRGITPTSFSVCRITTQIPLTAKSSLKPWPRMSRSSLAMNSSACIADSRLFGDLITDEMTKLGSHGRAADLQRLVRLAPPPGGSYPRGAEFSKAVAAFREIRRK